MKIQGNKLTINGESLENKVNTVDKKYSETFLAWKVFLNYANWVKLSNSGDFLKLIIPNHNWKIVSGWSNYSGTVTNHKMIEREIGYRGSKSDFILKSVKEQRVYGNWGNIYKLGPLRCILRNFERNSQIKILSKQLKLNKLFFSTLNIQPKLNPWFLSGLSDAESSFQILVRKGLTYKLGWSTIGKFRIDM